MAILPIIIGESAPILRTNAKKVDSIDKKTRGLIENMKETMLNANGVGLAAPQVNVNQRVIICRFEAGKKDEKVIAMINPEILWFSDDTVIDEEGCLSLPKVFAKISRPNSIRVRFQNEKGQEQTLDYSGFNARVIQHEVDHLNGVLFIDYLE